MFQSSDHRYFYEIQTAHSRTLMVFDQCSQRSYTSSNNKAIGKLCADGGLRDLLVDSGVHAGNTAELMLVGK
jgi:hypothetical protein